MIASPADPGPWDRLNGSRIDLDDDNPLIGYRYWLGAAGLELEGTYYPGAVLCPPLQTRGTSDLNFITSRSIPAAYCRHSDPDDHLVPGELCGCGYRLVKHPADLVEYIKNQHPRRRRGETATVIARVRGLGAAAAGRHDPNDTARVERIEILGPMWLSPLLSNTPNQTSLFRKTFGVSVIPRTKGTWDTWLDRAAREAASTTAARRSR